MKRHSRSVDVKRHCCGRCKGKLVEVDANNVSRKVQGPVDKTPKKRAPPSGYNLFVKEQSKQVREKLLREKRSQGILNPKVMQPEVIKECARLWREKKQAQ